MMPPHLRIDIQRLTLRPAPRPTFLSEDRPNRLVPAFKLEAASPSNRKGIRFSQAVVSYASSELGGAGQFNFTADGLNPADVRQMACGAIVRAEAGYIGGDGPPMRPIFYGHIQDVELGFEAGRHRWTFSCLAGGLSLYEFEPNLHEDAMLIEDAVHRIAEVARMSVGPLPPCARGQFRDYPLHPTRPPVTYAPSYATTTIPSHGKLNDLFTHMASEMRRAVREATGLERNIMWVMDPGDLFHVEFVDVTDYGGQWAGVERRVEYDLDSPEVSGGGLKFRSMPPRPQSPDEDDEAGEDEGESLELSVQDTFKVAMRFDPRLRIGIAAQAKSKPIGTIDHSVTEVVHDLVAWRSTIGGDLLSNPLLAADYVTLPDWRPFR